MYLKKVDGPRAVRLPDGQVITLADLPPQNTQRWVASRKAMVVRAVLYGLLSQTEAMKTYALSEEEFFEWVHAVRTHGDAGLKVTQLRALRQS
ncbi:DUF1153 domain-containing protein [uncultured Lentibacter sp.]|jgi:hypothetical protein|uniref:CtrA inhibitor SciP n=1 Tax=uncultured Lentibacter sp. TaxID=1659309 RepID=UPI002614973F|nr:DUF1153 domain-containing protein [uncultured Lentibacter sp.]